MRMTEAACCAAVCAAQRAQLQEFGHGQKDGDRRGCVVYVKRRGIV